MIKIIIFIVLMLFVQILFIFAIIIDFICRLIYIIYRFAWNFKIKNKNSYNFKKLFIYKDVDKTALNYSKLFILTPECIKDTYKTIF